MHYFKYWLNQYTWYCSLKGTEYSTENTDHSLQFPAAFCRFLPICFFYLMLWFDTINSHPQTRAQCAVSSVTYKLFRTKSHMMIPGLIPVLKVCCWSLVWSVLWTVKNLMYTVIIIVATVCLHTGNSCGQKNYQIIK